MKPPDWDRIQEIYHSALAQPRSRRHAFVSEACAGDLALVREVESLLEADESSGKLLDSPITILDPTPEFESPISGRYIVEKKLSSGAMSQVYFARNHKLNGQPVVIKVLAPELVRHSHLRKKFAHEVEALLRVDYPGVVRVLDRDELADGRPYIVMDYVDGQTLRSEIHGDGVNLKRAASILRQIGEALEHVHSKGIFHRDLKPENIMLRRGTDEVVLIDFGIAKVTNPEMAPTTTHASPLGTLLYMSPEQLLDGEVTAASDIYSMAVVAFEMITGRRPFKATSAPDLLDLQKTGVRGKLKQLGDDLSSDAQRIISRALSYEPQSRYQSAKEFGDELGRSLLPVLKSPPTPGERIRKNRYVLTATLIAALVLLSFLVYRYSYRPRDTAIRPLVTNTRPVESPSPILASRAFKYWLTVQKKGDGDKPSKSNGEELFSNGDKFQLTVNSPESAYVYVFNEGPPEENDTNFRLIYPNSKTNNGLAAIGKNQSIESNWFTFRGPEGHDNFWIVWSLSPVNELESAKVEAFKHPRGGLTGETLLAVKQFLNMKKSEIELTVYHYKKTKQATARGKGDLLIALAQFKHR